MNLSRPFWTEEATSWLRRLWEEQGLSATRCAEEMEVSRNAVIGRVHRCNMHHPNVPDHYPACYWPRRYKQQPQRQPKQPEPVLLLEMVSEHPVTFWELKAHRCRWPLGGPKEPAELFCSNVVADRYPYAFCEGHCRLAYI